MIGDIVLIQKIHRKKAEIILSEVIKRYRNKKMIITIAATSGVGKTECATVLQRQLWAKYKIKSKQIHVDDYYKVHWNMRDKIRKKTDIIGREEIDWEKLNKVAIKFKSDCKHLYVQRIHKFTDNIEKVICENSFDIMIVEGLYANYLEHKDFAVYLEGNPKQTYEFRKKRGKEDPDDEFRQCVVQRESNCVVQSKKYSNLIIPFEV